MANEWTEAEQKREAERDKRYRQLVALEEAGLATFKESQELTAMRRSNVLRRVT